MKLLVFSPYYPPHVGGLQGHAQQFNQHLAKTGAKINVFTSRLPRFAPAQEDNGAIKIIRFPAWEIIPNYPLPKFWQSDFWLTWRQIRAQKFNVVVSRTRFFFTSLLALAYAKSSHTPWLHIEHGSNYVSLSNPLTKLLAHLYDSTLGRLVLHSADAVVANSRASAAFVQRLSGRRARVIYRGLDQNAILAAPPARDLRQQYASQIIIAYLGRLIDGKGVDDLLWALKAIMPVAPGKPLVLQEKHQGLRRRDGERNGWHCLIIGDGPRLSSLKKLSTPLGLNQHVTFLGQQEFSQSMSLLKASDIFVNPSHTEGLPTSVIEAALCKTAIVATNVGGTPEIVTNNQSAFLIPPKQPNILADKIKTLIQNPNKRHLMSEHAYHEVINKFSWPASTAAYLKLLQKLIQTPGV